MIGIFSLVFIHRINSTTGGGSSKYDSRPYDGRDSRSARDVPRSKDTRYSDRDRSPHFRSNRPAPDSKPVMSDSRGSCFVYLMFTNLRIF